MESSASAETMEIGRSGAGTRGPGLVEGGLAPPQPRISNAVIPSGARDDSGLAIVARTVIPTPPAPSSDTSSAPTLRPPPPPRRGNTGRTPPRTLHDGNP